MKPKSLLTALCVATLAATAAFADSPTTPPPSAPPANTQSAAPMRPRARKMIARRLEHIDKAVGGLTDDQKAKIGDLFTHAQTQIHALPADQRREQAPAIMKATHDQVRTLLTPEQQAKFDQMPKPAAGRRGHGHTPDAE